MRTQTAAELAAMVEEYRSTRARMAVLTSELGAMTATARSADGSVTATVGPRGELCDLSIDANLVRRLDLTTLAARILEASGRAGEQARDEVARAVSRSLPGHLRPLVRPDGALDVASLLPAELRSRVGARAQERP
jgi:DNA-binding protein YbaB